MDVPAIPAQSLAGWLVGARGADPLDPANAGDITVAAYNLSVARLLGQLHLDLEGDTCTGFVGWVRLTPSALLRVARTGQRMFRLTDDTPHAPVLFLVEQLNMAPEALRHRMRWLSALPGVEVLAGWRGERLRVHRVRTR